MEILLPVSAKCGSAGEELDYVALGVAEHRDADVADREDVDLDRGGGGAEGGDGLVEVGDREGEVADAEGGGQADGRGGRRLGRAQEAEGGVGEAELDHLTPTGRPLGEDLEPERTLVEGAHRGQVTDHEPDVERGLQGFHRSTSVGWRQRGPRASRGWKSSSGIG